MSETLVEQMEGVRLIDLAQSLVQLIVRNLYERTADVRWWATDTAFWQALAEPDADRLAFAADRLGTINRFYSVYCDLVLTDARGRVVANADSRQARQLVGAAIILVSAVVLAWDGVLTRSPDAWIGDLLFIAGAVFFSFYVILSERWQLGAMQIIFCGTVVNAVIYLPIWALFLPSGLADAPMGPLLLQAVYQGFVPNLMGLLFIAHASRTIGNANTSSILAAVPGVGGLLGAVILGENLSPVSIAALVLLTIGLLISVRRRRLAAPIT